MSDKYDQRMNGCLIINCTVEKSFHTRVEASERVIEIAAAYGIGVDQEQVVKVIPEFQFVLRQGEICYITGTSGGGKSVLLDEIGKQAERWCTVEVWPFKKTTPIIDLIGKSSIDGMKILGKVGLGEAFIALRSYEQLSDGQKFRARLAYLLHRMYLHTDDISGSLVLIDEFCSKLDRVSAEFVSKCMRRWVKESGVGLVVATAHDDLFGALKPEFIINAGPSMWEISTKIEGIYINKELTV